MEFTVEPSDDGQYVAVTMIGDITRNEANEVLDSMYGLGLSRGINCYLLDVRRARNRDRPVVNVRFAMEDIPAVPGLDLRMVCVALLVDPSDRSHDFYAAFAQSQGIDTTLFWDQDEAVEHLTKAARRLNRPGSES